MTPQEIQEQQRMNVMVARSEALRDSSKRMTGFMGLLFIGSVGWILLNKKSK